MASITVAVPAITPPALPTNLNATPGNALVTLTWTAVGSTSGSPITYNVYRSSGSAAPTNTPPNAPWKQIQAGVQSATWTDLGEDLSPPILQNGTQYWYSVTAVDGVAGEGPPSAYISATPSLSAAQDPTSVALGKVNLYSTLGVFGGLLPGVPLNFAALLTLTVLMVRDIAAAFKQPLSGQYIKTGITGLVSAALDVGIGVPLQRAAFTFLPFQTFSSIVGYAISPALAGTVIKTIGHVVIKNFQTGKTVLDLDPITSQRQVKALMNQAASGTATP